MEMMRLTINRRMDSRTTFARWRINAPYKPITRKGLGQRMGGGKGAIDHYVTPVKCGRLIVEVGGHLELGEVESVLKEVAKKLPFPAKVCFWLDFCQCSRQLVCLSCRINDYIGCIRIYRMQWSLKDGAVMPELGFLSAWSFARSPPCPPLWVLWFPSRTRSNPIQTQEDHAQKLQTERNPSSWLQQCCLITAPKHALLYWHGVKPGWPSCCGIPHGSNWAGRRPGNNSAQFSCSLPLSPCWLIHVRQLFLFFLYIYIFFSL